jgi:hypothetical protein
MPLDLQPLLERELLTLGHSAQPTSMVSLPRHPRFGWSFLVRPQQDGRDNGEMKRLMLDHAFKFVQRVRFSSLSHIFVWRTDSFALTYSSPRPPISFGPCPKCSSTARSF